MEFGTLGSRGTYKMLQLGGHVARMGTWAPQRLVYKVARYKDSSYLKFLVQTYGSQHHGRKFKVWRWEQPFTKFLGSNWRDLAQDTETWADHKELWLSKRSSWTKFWNWVNSMFLVNVVIHKAAKYKIQPPSADLTLTYVGINSLRRTIKHNKCPKESVAK